MATGIKNAAKIAVLLAAYNGREWIEAQLASVLAQVAVNVDIFISVDPSTDGTELWCAEFAQAHANVVLLPSSGVFGGASRNFFRLIRDVDLSAYDFVAFADQDDIWYADKLEQAVATLRSSEAEGYSSNVVAFWADGRRLRVNKAQPQVRWDHLFEAAGPGCTYVLSRKLALAFKAQLLSCWDEAQHIDLHDWFCYAFARSRGYGWVIDPRPGLDYRQHERNQVGVNDGMASAKARWRKITNGWWFEQVLLTARLLQINSPFFALTGTHHKVKSWTKLAFSAASCRRRTRDRVMFFVICLLMGVLGQQPNHRR
ncbi:MULTISPECIES: glycosyltransferase [Pseudomonas]|uniref:Glycosyltransferase n=1 Tax=Pseudomonas monteilii TaxID=76759 RepID=A0A7X3JS46_9PSED|nr:MULTISPECIES: glycosyltransferase [Pseudomonas]MBA6137460.1 glycosyltransferase [Pseudomonas monteilii]MBI6918990.1 glycosyltransferase [Pseudomonas monteilii]MBZ3662147.1 glycosyltransferase [Pseudomonas monteilii]MBZ3667473.1 glycosyltransferase [Pseudomonas monteilii]MCA4076716.1 glycosyltransferase [Pseudomonas kurunegalensis]